MAKDDETKESAEGGGGKKKIIIIAIPVVLLLAAAGWFFFLKPKDTGVPEPLPHPVPGAVVTLDPITVNLAASHFLKLGMALQPTATALEVDGAKALDLAITQFTQMTIDELSTDEGRDKAKEELVARVKLSYLPHGTELVDAIGSTGESSGSSESDSEASSSEESAAAEEEIHINELSAEEAIEMADSLTVQADVYDIYFTEFVMQ